MLIFPVMHSPSLAAKLVFCYAVSIAARNATGTRDTPPPLEPVTAPEPRPLLHYQPASPRAGRRGAGTAQRLLPRALLRLLPWRHLRNYPVPRGKREQEPWLRALQEGAAAAPRHFRGAWRAEKLFASPPKKNSSPVVCVASAPAGIQRA